MRAYLVVGVIFIAAVTQYVECNEPALKCWTCSRRISADAPTHYCIQGNFFDDVQRTKRIRRPCKTGQVCVVNYKVSADGGKNVYRRCGDETQDRCDFDPDKNSTICYKSCKRSLCNRQSVSSLDNMMATATDAMTSGMYNMTEYFPTITTTTKGTTATKTKTTASVSQVLTSDARTSTLDKTTIRVTTPIQSLMPTSTSKAISTTNNEATTSGACNQRAIKLNMLLLAVALGQTFVN